MKYARGIALVVAVGAGLLAVRMLGTGGTPPEPPKQAPKEVASSDVLVAAKDIAQGQKLQAGDISWKAWPKDMLPQGGLIREAKGDAQTEEIVGQIARSRIYAGEPIRTQRLVATDKGYMAAILPKGKRAVAVGVGAETTAGGFILPGDKVDVILTRKHSGGATSEILLPNIKVLAIDTTTAGEEEKKSLRGRTATLELTPGQAEIVAQAQETGALSLALRSAQDSADDETEDEPRRGSVNFVKFGVSTQVLPR